MACPGAPEGRLPWSCPLFLEGGEAGASAPGVPATGLDPQGPLWGEGEWGQKRCWRAAWEQVTRAQERGRQT